MKTEPWWVCNKCGTPIQKVGKSPKGGGRLRIHSRECSTRERIATCSMRQVEQASGPSRPRRR